MADVNYQLPMQLMELLGLRGWEASQPRTYWGLKRPDGMPDNWAYPNVGAADGGSWGYQSPYGTTTGGGGGYGTATGIGGGAGAGASLASFLGAQRAFAPDVGGAGALEPGAFSRGDDEGLNAKSPTFGDWLGSFASPIGAGGSLVGQIAYNAITGQPNNKITNIGLGGLYGAAQSALGAGVGDTASGPGNFGSANLNAAMNVASGDYVGAGLDIFGSSPNVADATGGFDAGPSPGDPTGGQGPAGLSEGGPVTLGMLAGPNPPGPDDGLAYLDAGEHVLTADDVARLGGHAGVMRLRDLLRR